MEENNINVEQDDAVMYEVAPISIDDIKNIAENKYKHYTSLKWLGHDLIIRKIIPFEAVHSFVNSVADACFNSETGAYEPENRDFMYKYCEIVFFTNVELPLDFDDAYDVVYITNLNDMIHEYADQYQIADIQSSITEAIQYRIDQNLDSLKAELRGFEDVFKKLGETMSAIDPEEIKKTMDAISKHGKLDEAAVVKALFPNGGGKSNGKDKRTKHNAEDGKGDT